MGVFAHPLRFLHLPMTLVLIGLILHKTNIVLGIDATTSLSYGSLGCFFTFHRFLLSLFLKPRAIKFRTELMMHHNYQKIHFWLSW